MQLSELYLETKSELLQNCELIEQLNQSKASHEPNSTYDKLINDTFLLTRHLSIELCSLSVEAAQIQSNELRKTLTRFHSLRQAHQRKKKQHEEEMSVNAPTQATDSLLECKQLLEDAEGQSLNMIGELQGQTKHLEEMSKRLEQVDEKLSIGTKITNRMLTIEFYRNHTLKFVVLVAIGIAIGIKVYLS